MKLLAYHISRAATKEGQTLSAVLRSLGVHVTEAEDLPHLDISVCDAVLFCDGADQGQQPYVVAMALAQQKPVVFLLQKGDKIQPAIKMLSEDAKLAPLMHLKQTSPATLVQDIRGILNSMEQGILKEVPSIKFTLRITPTIERYLQWKSQESGLSKADVLREFIENDLIAKDEHFPKP